jgi:2-keto-4-pentenoate hydratase/2-oxohepta-3-ene-1,7-dioic acid hydratase in catechol pathway
MRIWRVKTTEGVRWAWSEGPKGKLFRLEGEDFAAWQQTDEPVGEHLVLAPLLPTAILAVGQNYRAHAAEMKTAVSEHPTIFMKNPAAVLDPGLPILLPRTLRSDKVDYEGELAVVIGRACRNATLESAPHHVLGYTIANDVSARDWQREWGGGQFCRGKSFDTFCPLGPCLVSGDELGDPGQLRLRTWVNGELRQDGSTADLISSIPALLVFLSGSTTLLPGTVILTGTPAGVGAGFSPPRYLAPGDEVAIEIEGLGRLVNRVREEPG